MIRGNKMSIYARVLAIVVTVTALAALALVASADYIW